MGATPLHYASSLEVVRELCHKGANVNAACFDDGLTPLMWASQEGYLGIVRELCDMVPM